MDPEEEEKHIVEAIEAVQKITGSADSPKGTFASSSTAFFARTDPAVSVGFYIGRRSNVSQRLYVRAAKEAGISGVYSSDSFSDDLPVRSFLAPYFASLSRLRLAAVCLY